MKASDARALAGAIVFAASDAVAGMPRLTVHHDDSFQGLSAAFAVRACVQPYQGLVLEVTEANTPQDVIVQLFDARGKEVGRHAGSRGVCGFARYASEYIRLDQDDPSAVPSTIEPIEPATR
jgi:hypothetical protein